ncbi:hypothetical protein SI65_02730 [Aspergillus cristatus]|uniref:Aldehyde dehydrogenase domain-containing protein n=1 Tax=Aspergillus cristatus TaxID=573508 RepID=A0A1E3BNE0_ASPCR|nr:hypothetical protein SI65_02730 [Aspergillus cristatus]
MSSPITLKNPSLFHNLAFSHGKWIEARSKARFDFDDPGTGKVFTTCPDLAAEDVDPIHHLIRDNRDDIATILTHETGKPLNEAYGEIDYATGFTWWFAAEAERIRGEVSTPAAPNRRMMVIKQPIGVCVALVPWNFPIAMILRKVGAALTAGCTMIAKPSPETPLTILSPPPPQCLQCNHYLEHKHTRSLRDPVIIARHCGEGIKKVTLELGGNCPFIIFDDANQERALEQLTALKIYEEFLVKLVEHAKTIKVGHGLEKSTTMGPLTTSRGVDKARHQIEDAVQHGAKIAHGGKPLSGAAFGNGYYFEPTILRDMDASMQVTQEESFAPIAAVYRFKTEDEVVQQANDTDMGLASYVFTTDVNRSWRMLEKLEAGMTGLNTGNSSAAESPFGGMKMSGYGKESGKDVAVAEYLASKTCTMTVEGALP